MLGWITTPAVNTVAVSGFKALLPPTCESSCRPVSPKPPSGTPAAAHDALSGEFAGKLERLTLHGSVATGAVSLCPRYSSLMFGARNAVEYVPLKVKSGIGV